MALTVIGGLLAATILTLVVEPCIYVVFSKHKKFREAVCPDASGEKIQG
jgi:Cu/Ag efflux pump CusA